MKVPSAGREYAHWTVTDLPADVVIEVSADDGATWHVATRDGDTTTVLVAGPDATDNPAGTVVLAAGRNHLLHRAADTPEVVIRDAGAIDVD